jgi:hypothetical protein
MASSSSGNSYIKYAEAFNHSMKVLTRGIARTVPEDAIAARIQKRANVIMAIDPLAVIKRAGPLLYEYREKIYDFSEDAETFALSLTFEAEIEQADDEDTAHAKHLIPLIKKCWDTFTRPEKDSYRELLVDLLDNYIEFTTATATA